MGDDIRENRRKQGCARNLTMFESAVSKFRSGLQALPAPDTFRNTLAQLQDRLKDNNEQKRVNEVTKRKIKTELEEDTRLWQTHQETLKGRQEKHVGAYTTLTTIESKLKGEEERVLKALDSQDSLTTATSLIEVMRTSASSKVTQGDITALAAYLSGGLQAPSPEEHKQELHSLLTKLKTTLSKSLGLLKSTYQRGKSLYLSKVGHLQGNLLQEKTREKELETTKSELHKKVFAVGEMAAKTMNTRLLMSARLNTTAVLLDATRIRCALGLRTHENQVEYRKREMGILDQIKDYVLNEMREHAELLNHVALQKRNEALSRTKSLADLSVEQQKITIAKEKNTELTLEKKRFNELKEQTEITKLKIIGIKSGQKVKEDEETADFKRKSEAEVDAKKKVLDEDLKEKGAVFKLKLDKEKEETEMKKDYTKQEKMLEGKLKVKDEETNKDKIKSDVELKSKELEIKSGGGTQVAALSKTVNELMDKVKVLTGEKAAKQDNVGKPGKPIKGSTERDYGLPPEIRAMEASIKAAK